MLDRHTGHDPSSVLCCRLVALLTTGTRTLGQTAEPWVILWRRGADADLLRQQLCSGEPGAAGTSSYGINCTARFTSLANGIAGMVLEWVVAASWAVFLHQHCLEVGLLADGMAICPGMRIAVMC